MAYPGAEPEPRHPAFPEAEPERAPAAVLLVQVRDCRCVLLDYSRLILAEYLRNARPSGEPGAGDAFLKWLLTNLTNTQRCAWVSITPEGNRGFEEFPDRPDLAGFDDDDRKFVAVALVSAMYGIFNQGGLGT